MTIRVGQRGTYVERIAKNNFSSPFLKLSQYGVEDIQRISEYQNFKLGEHCLMKTKNGLRYGKIVYIVNIINQCKLYDETIFLLNNYNETLWTNVYLKHNFLLAIVGYSLEENSILISGSVGSYGIFDGFGGIDSVDDYRILAQNILPENKLGEMHYGIFLPDFAQQGIDASKIPRKKHVAKMKHLNYQEVEELRARGINIEVAKHLQVEDGCLE